MAKDHNSHFIRFSLIAVFLVAVITILALVALVVNSSPTQLARGSEFATAESNVVGDAKLRAGNVIRYEDYDNTDFTLEFGEMQTGMVILVAVRTDGTATLVKDGKSYPILVDNRTSSSPRISILIKGKWQMYGDDDYITLK